MRVLMEEGQVVRGLRPMRREMGQVLLLEFAGRKEDIRMLCVLGGDEKNGVPMRRLNLVWPQQKEEGHMKGCLTNTGKGRARRREVRAEKVKAEPRRNAFDVEENGPRAGKGMPYSRKGKKNPGTTRRVDQKKETAQCQQKEEGRPLAGEDSWNIPKTETAM